MPQGLYQRGIEASLDAMQELAGINTVMTFSNNMVAKQYRPEFGHATDPETGQPITDVFVHTDEAHYASTSLRQAKNPTHLYADRDLLNELAEAARPRNMQVYARILEPYTITGAIPGLEACAEVDIHGATANTACFNHPDYVNFWEAVVTDLVTGHSELAGFKFGQERGGPFMKAIGGGDATCFCQHCTRLAESQNINVDEARAGFTALKEFGEAHRQPLDAPVDERRPNDGYLVSILRILSKYPALLAWERFWMDSRENQRRRIYTTIKKIRPSVQVGWHIDHGMSWDLITRATWDYADMVEHADWLSVGLYFDCMGPRSFNHFRKNYEALMFADARPDLAHAMYFSLLGYDPKVQPSYADQLKAQCSLTADYVDAETRRAVEAVRTTGSKAQVHPRVGFNVPMNNMEVSENEVYEATTRALKRGADGLWLGREWDELKPANAAAFGRAVRDWQQAK